MDLTKEPIQYDLLYFKSIERLEKAIFFRKSTFDSRRLLCLLRVLFEKYSKFAIVSTQEVTGVIYTHLNKGNFAVLPTAF